MKSLKQKPTSDRFFANREAAAIAATLASWLAIASVLALALILTGCTHTTRSISNSTYPQTHNSYRSPGNLSDPAFDYRGELSEFDVLGINRDDLASESEIRRALDNSRRVKMHRDSSILLIQSGALFPDGAMTTELGKHFTVVPFSGVPPFRRILPRSDASSVDPESYSKSLRLAAARGGNDFIVCYWGLLESDSQHLPTKTVSWVPLVNWLVPDEKTHLQIRLKVAVIEVRSGNWTIFSPEPFENARISTPPRRGAADQNQVERLKKLAYEASARELVRRYSDADLRAQQ